MDVWELYDLQTDPNEMNNLYGQDDYAAIEQSLHNRLVELQREFDDLP